MNGTGLMSLLRDLGGDATYNQDGYAFDISIRYTDGTQIDAKGYEKYPKNYKQGHKKLSRYLEKIK